MVHRTLELRRSYYLLETTRAFWP